MPDDISQYIQGLQLLGGVLALPRSSQYAQQDALQKRAMLKDTGLSDIELKSMYPDAPLGFLRAGSGPEAGVGRKILGGVGDVGALISTIAGKPVGPPRTSIDDIAAASKLRKGYKEQQALQQFSAMNPDMDPTERLLIEAGNLDGAARVHAARLRAGGGGDFGKSALGQRARLNFLRKNDPTNKEIPALESALAEDERLHPATAPPKTYEQEMELERGRQGVRDKVEADRRAGIIAQNPKWTDEQKDYYRANGSMYTPQRDPVSKPLDFYRDILQPVVADLTKAAEEARRNRSTNPDEITVSNEKAMAIARERVKTYVAGGFKVENIPPEPTQQPPGPQEPEMSTPDGPTGAPTGAPPPGPPKSPLSDIHLTDPTTWTPEQRAAAQPLIAEAESQKQGNPPKIAPTILQQRLIAIPGLVVPEAK